MMMFIPNKKYRAVISAVICLAVLITAAPVHAAEVRISAASGLTDLIKALTVEYNKKNPETAAQFIFGTTASSEKPGASGLPIDIYVTSNPGWMKFLEDQGKIFPGSVEILAVNTLVVIGPKDKTIESVSDLSSLSHIAIANPKSSPSGQCAEQILKASKLYDSLIKKEALIITKDIRQSLMFTDREEITAAIVFQTEALQSKNSQVIFTIPEKLYEKVTYPVALTHAGDKNDTARLFYSFILSPAVADIMKKKGFTAPVREK